MTPVDLLFRSSGEVRLSDFMLWQTSYAPLVFDETLWPELTIWKIMKAVFEYQQYFDVIEEAKGRYLNRRQHNSYQEFKHFQTSSSLIVDYETYQEERMKKIDFFKVQLDQKRRKMYQKIMDETEGKGHTFKPEKSVKDEGFVDQSNHDSSSE